MLRNEFTPANLVFQANRGPPYAQVVDAVTLDANASGAPSFAIKGGDYLWTHAVAQSTGAFRHRINATWQQRYLDNGQIRSALFWGTSQLPQRIPPTFLPDGATLSFELEDLSGSSNTIRLVLWGFRALPGDAQAFGRDHDLLVLTTAAAGVVLAANGPGAPVFEIPYDTHFMATAHASAQTNAAWLGTFAYKDVRQKTRSLISQARMRSECWTGVNTAPFFFPSPLLLEAKSSVEYDLLDASGSSNTVHLHLIGARMPLDRARW